MIARNSRPFFMRALPTEMTTRFADSSVSGATVGNAASHGVATATVSHRRCLGVVSATNVEAQAGPLADEIAGDLLGAGKTHATR